ncbi:coniferyl aldehyde dehydrogenase [Candidatus Enterovibrio altilux]|uniref:Aldehyde dehydrogenase n=1 Tax=Candidatus Enterovibrio altilux TaxID=1927128 RepID=A0A291B6S3_9GAMM|nr:coniferyl aldehyde dehydrogenase [Candidatus Enterovibrio luxaltus]ATF08686.1 Aldehyde dehydrogenase [Candidatus Enterovibrio luxaltus]
MSSKRCNDSVKQPPQHELEDWFHSLKAAYQHDPLPTLALRKKRLMALKTQLRRYQNVLADAISEDFGGRSHYESLMADVLGPILNINHVLSHLSSWMRPKRRPTEWLFKGNKLEIRYYPKGVVGIVCPWNFPIYLSLGPLITALAAGNSSMIKMPPNCEATTQVLQTMLKEIYPNDLVCVVSGNHPQAMTISHFSFDHFVFTGSPNSGKIIMANASANLMPITLELGGKSPAIIFEDYNIQKAAQRIAHGKCFNAGQLCIAPDHAFVPINKVNYFVDALVSAYNTMYPNIKNNPDCTSLVNVAQYQRFKALVNDAIVKGATITLCTKEYENRRLPLHIATHLTPNMRICQEEIFGPLLPVFGYENLEDVLQHMTEREKPLACYLFSHNKVQRDWVLEHSHSGGVTINDWGWHALNHSVPFGGVGHSGIGNYHGEEGFKELSHARTVLQMRRWFPIHVFTPPYRNRMQKLVMKMLIGKADSTLLATRKNEIDLSSTTST